MADKKFYSLPDLPYAYNALEPYISETQLKIHHDKHHAAYVNGANTILERLDKARQAGTDVDIKATLKNSPSRSADIPCTVSSGRTWHRE